MSKSITATTSKQELATAEELAALGAFAGFQELSREDVGVPFLSVLQPLSPQVTPGAADYIEGARPGQIYQNISHELRSSVLVAVAEYRRSFIEWVPRDAGGGFRGETSPAESEAQYRALLNRETGKARLENGNDLVDTRSFFVLVSTVQEDGTESVTPAIVSMASTQIKVAKGWMNLILNYTPPGAKPNPMGAYPPWAAVYSLGTVLNKNDKGSWYGWRVERAGFNRSPVLREAAAAFHKQVRAGAVRVDRNAETEGATGTDGAI